MTSKQICEICKGKGMVRAGEGIDDLDVCGCVEKELDNHQKNLAGKELVENE